MANIIHNKEICGGKACIKGTRIRVIDIVERYKFMQEKPEEIARVYNLPVEVVLAALSYYYTNLQEIQGEIENDKELVRKLRFDLQPIAYAT